MVFNGSMVYCKKCIKLMKGNDCYVYVCNLVYIPFVTPYGVEDLQELDNSIAQLWQHGHGPVLTPSSHTPPTHNFKRHDVIEAVITHSYHTI